MRRRSPGNLAEAFSDFGHALLLAMLGGALLAGWVVGVARSPENVAVGVGFLVAAVLLGLEAFGLLPGLLTRAAWVVLLAATAAFVGINFF